MDGGQFKNVCLSSVVSRLSVGRPQLLFEVLVRLG
jgi:hypothetical protein